MTRAAQSNKGAVHGVLLLNKPSGITSQAAVSRVKRLLDAAKAGHTGTLDPLAEGLLPICLGEATKFSQGLLEAQKSYRARVRLGCRTDTGDMEGEVLEMRDADATPEAVGAVLARFRGEITQTPPMYSALKRNGRPLYAYARSGETVERCPRRVQISQLELEANEGAHLQLLITCSKGTYVRVLAEDIGAALGCGACLAALTRLAVGDFVLRDAVTVEELEQMIPAGRRQRLLPVDALVANLPRVELSSSETARIQCGQTLCRTEGLPPGLIRLYAPDDRFVGLGEAGASGEIAPRRLVSGIPAPHGAS